MSERDPMFDGILSATRRELDRGLARSTAQPDFAAVIERAHALDPSVVEASAVAEVRARPPIVARRSGSAELDEQGSREPDHDLGEFTVALRERIEADLGEHRTRAIPAPRFARPPRLPRSRAHHWAAAVAALLLFGGAVSAMIGGDLWESSDRDDAVGEVVEPIGDQPAPASVDEPKPEPKPEPERQTETETEPESGSSELSPSDPVPSDPVPSELAPSERPGGQAHAPEPDPSIAEQPSPSQREHAKPDPLALLDARAQALWRAGDLDGAERLFAEIVRRGGRGRWAELAYAELFSLTQRHGADKLDDLWRDYLVRFPKGRYAEDARAGLCRHQSGSQGHACWSDYLERHPQGTHANEAARALELDNEGANP